MATRMLTWWATGALCLYNLAYTWYMGRAGQARSAGVEWLRWPPALGAVAAMAAVSSALVAGAGVDAVMTAFAVGGLVGVVPLTWLLDRAFWADRIPAGRDVGDTRGIRN